VARMMPRSEAGKRAVHFFGHEEHGHNDNEPMISDVESRDESALEISEKFLRGGFGGCSFDAEEVVNLTDEDDERNARGESADDGGGDEGDEATKPQDADEEQERA
jgi:hypothetical protein